MSIRWKSLLIYKLLLGVVFLFVFLFSMFYCGEALSKLKSPSSLNLYFNNLNLALSLSQKQNLSASNKPFLPSLKEGHKNLLEEIKKEEPQVEETKTPSASTSTKQEEDAPSFPVVKKDPSPSLTIKNETEDSAVLIIEEKGPDSLSKNTKKEKAPEKKVYSCSETFTDEYSPGYIRIGYNCNLNESSCVAFYRIERNRCEGLHLIRYYCDPKAEGLVSTKKIKCPKGCHFADLSSVCIQ